MPILALLGDSILDNAPYVGGAPDTTEHLRRLLGPSWTVHLLARDGAVMADVPDQLARLPGPADALVLSAGGNDALEHVGLLTRRASSVAEVLAEVARIAAAFDAEYDPLLAALASRGGRVIACTIYEAPLEPREMAELARVPLAVLNDRIVRGALRRGVDVVDLRAVCTAPGDFVQQIEPSATGARKIAEALAAALLGASRAVRLHGA